MRASDARKALRLHASPDQARTLARFFKTGPGQYGEGDRFIGVMVPRIRQVARQHQALPLIQVTRLVQSKIHEERLLGLIILVLRYERAASRERAEIYRFYLAHRASINNWDLVDVTAPQIVGRHLLTRDRRVLYRLARSRRLWDRRIAIVSTFAFIRAGDHGDTLSLAHFLLRDEHDLMHKAAGWMLREVGKRDLPALRAFLNEHASVMPRTMLRYAIEKMAVGERRRYMAARSQAGVKAPKRRA